MPRPGSQGLFNEEILWLERACDCLVCHIKVARFVMSCGRTSLKGGGLPGFVCFLHTHRDQSQISKVELLVVAGLN